MELYEYLAESWGNTKTSGKSGVLIGILNFFAKCWEWYWALEIIPKILLSLILLVVLFWIFDVIDLESIVTTVVYFGIGCIGVFVFLMVFNGGVADILPTTSAQSFESQFSVQIKEAMDYTNPTTRDYALSLISQSHSGEYNIAQICDMWEAAYGDWTYVNDPKGTEYVSPASRTIRLGLKGDCDDFAILIGSIIQATGGSSRVITAKEKNGDGHAYAEVFIARDKTKLQSIAKYICTRYHCKSVGYHTHYDENQNPQYWLNLDWSASHPGGPCHQASEMTAYYSNGYWIKISSTT